MRAETCDNGKYRYCLFYLCDDDNGSGEQVEIMAEDCRCENEIRRNHQRFPTSRCVCEFFSSYSYFVEFWI